jgi:glycosyltransferase involved in cell wall biosynthesis
MRPVDILIPNYSGHEALKLCIESIRRRTNYPSGYKIIVLDNPGDGSDRTWLNEYLRADRIDMLIEEDQNYKSGESLVRLLRKSGAPLACALESDCEILHGGWLTYLAQNIKDWNHDVLVARFFPPQIKLNHYWTPAWGPECALVNMPLYREMADGTDDWQQRGMAFTDYAHKEIFDGIAREPGMRDYVNLDTGWRIYEKLRWENRWGFSVQPIGKTFFSIFVKHYGGISTRGDRPEIQPRLAEIRRRLKSLTEEEG